MVGEAVNRFRVMAVPRSSPSAGVAVGEEVAAVHGKARAALGEGNAPRGALVLLGLAGGVAAIAAFSIPPAGDDWSTLRPIASLRAALLPGLFWRPLGNLLLLWGRYFPAMHLGWMHAWTVAGHLASAALVWVLARRAAASSVWVPVGAAGLYCLWAGNAAAALSPDAATQTWSTACGLATAWWALRVIEGKRGGWPWAIAAVLAALWKESGVAWFVAAPLLAAWLSGRPEDQLRGRDGRLPGRRLAGSAVRGGVLACAYFAARFALAGRVSLGDESGRYALSFLPLGMATRAAMLLAASLVPLDTVALFGTPRQPLLLAATALLALPCLLLLGASGSSGRWGRSAAVFLLAGVVASPSLVLGHVSEMYVHPIAAVLFVGAAEVAAVAAGRWPRRLAASWALILVASLIAFGHKALEMRRSGGAALAVAATLERQRVAAERPCLLRLRSEEGAVPVYSVFQMPPGPAAQWGESVTFLHGWRLPLPVVASADCSASCRTLLRVAHDGTVRTVPCTPPASPRSAADVVPRLDWLATAATGEAVGAGDG